MKSWHKKVLLMLVFSVLFLGIGYLAALFISNRNGYFVQDVLFFEGLIVLIIGVILSMGKGSVNFWGLSRTNLAQIEIDRMERKSPGYNEDFLKHSAVKFAYSSLTIIFSGLLLVLLSVILGR